MNSEKKLEILTVEMMRLKKEIELDLSYKDKPVPVFINGVLLDVSSKSEMMILEHLLKLLNGLGRL